MEDLQVVPQKDSQITALAGLHYLISELLAQRIEVAIPVRDHGIDLIAYVDQADTSGRFFACPIQLKTAFEERFILYKKYEKFPNLLMVYAWKLGDERDWIFYALSYDEAKRLLRDGKTDHTKSVTWKEKGVYHLKVGEYWQERLNAYEIKKPSQWKDKIREVSELESPSHLRLAPVKE